MVAHSPLGDAEMIAVIRFEARQLRHRLPAGYDQDDLESVGNEAAVEALARADRTDPARFKATMRLTIRNRMKDFLKSLKVKGRAMARLPADADENEMPVRDLRADDPADRAAAREVVLAPGAGKVVVRNPALPSPDVAAAKAAALREVMFGAIRADHVLAMMAAIGEKAADGDLPSARFIRDLIDRPQAGPVQQTAVIINGSDV